MDDWPDDFVAAPAPVKPLSQSLPEDLFCAPAEPTFEDGGGEWGDFAGSAQPLQQVSQHGPAASGGAEISKGACVWYLDTRSQSWREAQVVHVDLTLQPLSYGIELPGGAFRETEQHRLRPRLPGTLPPYPPATPGSPAHGINGHAASTHVAATAGGAPRGTAAAAAGSPSAAAAAPVAVAAGAGRGQGQEEDDFGDFAAAAPAGPPPVPSPALHPLGPPPVTGAAVADTLPAAASPTAAASGVSSPQRWALGVADSSLRHVGSGPSPPTLRSFRTFLHSAIAEVADQMDAEDEVAAAAAAAATAAAEYQAQQAQQRSPAQLGRQEGQQQPPQQQCAQQQGQFAWQPTPVVAGSAALPLHMPARQSAPSLPAVGSQLRVVQQEQRGEEGDDFGDFAAAGPAQPPASLLAQPQQQVAAAAGAAALQPPPPPASRPAPLAVAPVPAGVQRDAPLPLELFGVDEAVAAEAAVEVAVEVAAAGAAVSAEAAGAAGPGVAAGPLDTRPGQQQQQQQQLSPAAQAAAQAAAAAVDGWGSEDDFADFQGPADPEPAKQQQPPPLPPPRPAQQQQQQQWSGAEQLQDESERPPLPPQQHQQQQAPSRPTTFRDPAGRLLAVDYADRFVRSEQHPAQAASAVAAPSAAPAAARAAAAGMWSNGEEDSFAGFEEAPPAGSQPGGPAAAGAAMPVLLVATPALAPAPDEDGPAPDAGSTPMPVAAAATATAAAAAEQDGCSNDDDGGEGSAGDFEEFCSAPAAEAADAAPTPEGAAAGADGAAAAAPAAAAAAELPAQPQHPQPAPLGEAQQQVHAWPAGSESRKPSALLSALHPVSPRGSASLGSSPPGVPPSPPRAQLGWQAAALPSVPGGPAVAQALGAEVVTEYAVAWARLLQAAAQQLHASADVWSEAGRRGCWQELAASPATQQHLTACGQLYCAAAVVRLAAQHLGLLSLVPELQEGWAQAEAAWQRAPALLTAPEASQEGEQPGAGEAQHQDHGQGQVEGQPPAASKSNAEAEPGERPTQPPFREAVLAASAAMAAGSSPGLPELSALPLLAAVEGAPAVLENLSLDEFPRLLAWSEGLCGLTLLPLSLFEGCAPVAPWNGRPCLAPLANLWIHRVSAAPPQLD